MLSKAAFYDVDGTLVRTNIVHAYAYYAMNRGLAPGHRRADARRPSPRFPLFGVAGRGRTARSSTSSSTATTPGFTEDRLVTLAEELFEDVLKPRIFPGART